jgi:hypothetical protein
MNLNKRIDAFAKLGVELKAVLDGNAMTESGKSMEEELYDIVYSNSWFTQENMFHRIASISASCDREILNQWLSAYSFSDEWKGKKVAVILAGNIPMVGFDDFRCVLMSGNNFIGKLSSDDKYLLPIIGKILCEIEPEFSKHIEFTDGRLKEIDAVIATGSNNSARHFEYYFSKYPHIIRKNRNSVAVITGNETKEELCLLGEDVFRYFGLGCRNVTKLYVPENYVFDSFFEAIVDRGEALMANTKYMNNYEYHRTLYLLGNAKLLDNNFLLIKEDTSMISPVGVLFYERYSDIEITKNQLTELKDQLQCKVGKPQLGSDFIGFGTTQITSPLDYADGVDVMQFLADLP